MRHSWFLCVSWVLAIAAAAGCESSEEKRDKAARADNARDLPPFTAKLVSQVLDHLPDPATLRPVSCPPDLVAPEKVPTDSSAHRIHVVHVPTLRQIVDRSLRAESGKAKRQPAILTTRAYQWLTADPDAEASSVRGGYQQVAGRRYLGVFLEGEYSFGKMENDEITEPAWYKGWFTVFDLEQGKLVAAFPAEHRSMDTVIVTKQKGKGVSWSKELRHNLTNRVIESTVVPQMQIYCPALEVIVRDYS